MSKTQVYDRWHLSRVSKERAASLTSCEHSTKARNLYASDCHSAGMRWQVRWRDHDGKQHKENFDRKSDADKRAATIQADMSRGSYIDPQAGKETFRTVAERYLEGAIHKQSTADNAAQLLSKHAYPILGNRQISVVKRSDLQSWVKDRSQILKPSSLKVTFGYVKTVFRTAVQDGVIARNPCEGVKLPAIPKPEVHPLPKEVVAALIKAAPEQYRPLVLVAAASGLRIGELLGLELDGIDLHKGEIRVVQQLASPARGVPYLTSPKSHSSVRTVPLAANAVAAIKTHLGHSPIVPVLLWDWTDPRKPVERKAHLVFRDNGKAVRRSSWNRQWAQTVKRANAQLAKDGSPLRVPEGTGVHDLRHFYASLLIKYGENVPTVQKRLGHAKASITLDTYVHLWKDDADTTRTAVEEGIGDLSCDPDVTPQP
ncbi:tyrosine-type recombinase/integrase [Streptomyces sp. NPDC085529]|uniref:tyrosine-type recombinase/integrase n=1 Tax=Streptomyces sp. NPDC085529 TaxID=3365729 RepID=UPI0037CE07E1